MTVYRVIFCLCPFAMGLTATVAFGSYAWGILVFGIVVASELYMLDEAASK